MYEQIVILTHIVWEGFDLDHKKDTIKLNQISLWKYKLDHYFQTDKCLQRGIKGRPNFGS